MKDLSKKFNEKFNSKEEEKEDLAIARHLETFSETLMNLTQRIIENVAQIISARNQKFSLKRQEI